ncbi:MAG: hypothetical protein DRN71_04685 [Candidatus Nanohalarchaeota archaeon]|nr:MAG: hypothetical protein DRN71_04685 [Candidatus Nanohaloarchaeota archaeon]
MSVLGRIEMQWDAFERGLVCRFSSGQKKLWDILVFLVRFLILAIPLHVLLWLNFDAHVLQVATVSSVAFLLSLAGVPYEVVDVFLLVDCNSFVWTIEIIKDCVGWKSFMAVSGLMFAVRKVALSRRMIGVLAALPLIYAGNVFRIFTSIYLSIVFGYEWFDFIHSVLWQGGLIALVIVIWWVWLEKVADVGGENQNSKENPHLQSKKKKIRHTFQHNIYNKQHT